MTMWDPGPARRPSCGHSGHLVIPEQRSPRTSPRPHSWDRLHSERGAPASLCAGAGRIAQAQSSALR